MKIVRWKGRAVIRRANILGKRMNRYGFLDVETSRSKCEELGIIRSSLYVDCFTTEVLPGPVLACRLHPWLYKPTGFLPRPTDPPAHRNMKLPEGVHVYKKQHGNDQLRIGPYFGKKAWWEMVRPVDMILEYYVDEGFLQATFPEGYKRYQADFYAPISEVEPEYAGEGWR